MRAPVHDGPRDVSVEQVPDARIEAQAHDHSGTETPAGTYGTPVDAVRATGGIGGVGVFRPTRGVAAGVQTVAGGRHDPLPVTVAGAGAATPLLHPAPGG